MNQERAGEDIPYLKHQDKLRAKSLQPSPSVVQLPPPASILSACLGRRGPGVSCNHISAFCSAKPEQTGTRSLHHVPSGPMRADKRLSPGILLLWNRNGVPCSSVPGESYKKGWTLFSLERMGAAHTTPSASRCALGTPPSLRSVRHRSLRSLPHVHFVHSMVAAARPRRRSSHLLLVIRLITVSLSLYRFGCTTLIEAPLQLKLFPPFRWATPPRTSRGSPPCSRNHTHVLFPPDHRRTSSSTTEDSIDLHH